MSDDSHDPTGEGEPSANSTRPTPPPRPRQSSIPPPPDGITGALRVPTEPPRPTRRSSMPASDPDRPVSKRTPIPPIPEDLARLSEPPTSSRATPTTPVPAAPVVPFAPGVSSIPAAPSVPASPLGIGHASTPPFEPPRSPAPSAPEIQTRMSSAPPLENDLDEVPVAPYPSESVDEPRSDEEHDIAVDVSTDHDIPVELPTDDDIAAPIQAMRVIKLSEASKKGAVPPPPPEIEASETSVEEIEEGLDRGELAALNPTSPPPPDVDIPVEEIEPAPDSAEVFEDPIEEVAPVAAAAPPPPQRSSEAPQLEVAPVERRPPPPRRSAKPSLPTVKTPRTKPWWETLFGDDFSRAYRPMSQSQLSREVDFILEQLNVPRGAVILDLGCGQGEICVELSRRGYSIVGYDLSVFQLAMAGDNAQQAKQKINFLQGDMREMAFDQMFDAVICWDTTFGYFEDDKNVDVLKRIRQALKPNGRFVLDVMNRDFAAREAPMNHWFEGDGCVCMDDMTLDWITNRLQVKRSIILDDGRSKELQYSTRLYTLSEVGRMLHDVGFRVSAVSGDVATRGAFFGPHSRRIIIQAGKP